MNREVSFLMMYNTSSFNYNKHYEEDESDKKN